MNLVAEVTSYLGIIYTSLSSDNIELCIQLFRTLNEFASVSDTNISGGILPEPRTRTKLFSVA